MCGTTDAVPRMTHHNTRWDDLLWERVQVWADRLSVTPSELLRSIVRRDLDRKDRRRNQKS